MYGPHPLWRTDERKHFTLFSFFLSRKVKVSSIIDISIRTTDYRLISSERPIIYHPRDLGRVTSKNRKVEISKITIPTYYFKPKPTTGPRKYTHTHDDDGRFSFCFSFEARRLFVFPPTPRLRDSESGEVSYLFQLLFESRR